MVCFGGGSVFFFFFFFSLWERGALAFPLPSLFFSPLEWLLFDQQPCNPKSRRAHDTNKRECGSVCVCVSLGRVLKQPPVLLKNEPPAPHTLVGASTGAQGGFEPKIVPLPREADSTVSARVAWCLDIVFAVS